MCLLFVGSTVHFAPYLTGLSSKMFFCEGDKQSFTYLITVQVTRIHYLFYFLVVCIGQQMLLLLDISQTDAVASTIESQYFPKHNVRTIFLMF